jgi:hypothetical protein
MGSIFEKKMYNKDMILRKSRGTSKSEEVKTKKKPMKLMFELRNKEHDSDDSTKSDEEVEHAALVVRTYEQVQKLAERYSSPNSHFSFVLSTIDDEPKLFREVVD